MTSEPPRELTHQLRNLLAVIQLQVGAARRASTREVAMRALELIEESARQTAAALARAKAREAAREAQESDS